MGDNIYLGDRDSVRTPMQWSYDRNAGFSRANPQKLFLPVIIDPEYHYEAINVEAQQNNPSSLLWWLKRLISLRKQHKVFGRGDVRFLRPDHRRILAFVRTLGADRVLVIANLSRFSQPVEVDLSDYEGLEPVEMFGRAVFPKISARPYFLSLGPHSFHWFELREPDERRAAESRREIPTIEVTRSWDSQITASRRQSALEKLLPGYLRGCRWFRGKSRVIAGVRFIDSVAIAVDSEVAQFTLIQVDYVQDSADMYLLPLAFAEGERARALLSDTAHAVIASVKIKPGRSAGRSAGRSSDEPRSGVIYDAMYGDLFARALLQMFTRRKPRPGQGSELTAVTLPGFRALRRAVPDDMKPRVVAVDQTNTSINYGDALIFKLNRQIESGVQPELEVCRYLTEKAHFEYTPRLAGFIHYKRDKFTAAVGLLQQYIPNQGNAWQFTLDSLRAYFDRALSLPEEHRDIRLGPVSLLQRTRAEIPPLVRDCIGPYLVLVRQLGERSAQMHLALAGSDDEPDFAPVAFSTLYQRSLYQAARTTLGSTFELFAKGLGSVPQKWRELARDILARRNELDARLKTVTGARIEAVRSRCHGDFHLGQVLYTGSDFVIIDFEGEPARPIGERRIKRSPLRDVAGMLRSFHYAAVFAAHDLGSRPMDAPKLERWGHIWHSWISAAYLDAYLQTVAGSSLVPEDEKSLCTLLDFYCVDKCIYELGYELNHRPEWVWVPLTGLYNILSPEGQGK
jgi:maltose alpha-D-glucosyltransferase/alpha-amylase